MSIQLCGSCCSQVCRMLKEYKKKIVPRLLLVRGGGGGFQGDSRRVFPVCPLRRFATKSSEWWVSAATGDGYCCTGVRGDRARLRVYNSSSVCTSCCSSDRCVKPACCLCVASFVDGGEEYGRGYGMVSARYFLLLDELYVSVR